MLQGGVLTPDVPNYIGKFDDAVTSYARGGTYAGGRPCPECWTEALMVTAAAAVSQVGPGDCNDGFIRPEALLHVVVVSDEVDQSPDVPYTIEGSCCYCTAAQTARRTPAGTSADPALGNQACTAAEDDECRDGDGDPVCTPTQTAPIAKPGWEAALEALVAAKSGNAELVKVSAFRNGFPSCPDCNIDHVGAGPRPNIQLVSDQAGGRWPGGAFGGYGYHQAALGMSTDAERTAGATSRRLSAPGLDADIRTVNWRAAGTPPEDYMQELAAESKVLGTYKLDQLPVNFTHVSVSVGGVSIHGPKSLHRASGGYRPNTACTSDNPCLFDVRLSGGGGIIQFDNVCPSARSGLARPAGCVEFQDGTAAIDIGWDEPRTECLIQPACTEDDVCYVCYILMACIFAMLIFGAYQAALWQKERMVAAQLEEANRPPPPIEIFVRCFNGDVHTLQLSEEMTVTEVKAQIEKTAGIPADEQRLFLAEASDSQLEGPQLCSEIGVVSGTTLTLMQIWTLFVREANTDEGVLRKAAALGLDIAAKVHTLEGVERHWRLESVQMRIEAVTGIPPNEQQLTFDDQQLDPAKKLTDYPLIRNRSELQLVDLNPKRKVLPANAGGAQADSRHKADSVLSMARLFQSGHTPGSSLSDLQEQTMQEKHKAKYVSLFRSYRADGDFSRTTIENADGKRASISGMGKANLHARAIRAKHVDIDADGRPIAAPPEPADVVPTEVPPRPQAAAIAPKEPSLLTACFGSAGGAAQGAP